MSHERADRMKDDENMTEFNDADAPGENIAFKDFLGPYFGLAVDSVVSSLPDPQHMQPHVENVIGLKQEKEVGIRFLYGKDLRFRSGEKVLLAAIDEELRTVDFHVLSLDLSAPHTTVKVHAVYGTDWKDHHCRLAYRATPERGEWFRFSIHRDLYSYSCELEALFASSCVTQVIRHTAMTAKFLLQLK